MFIRRYLVTIQVCNTSYMIIYIARVTNHAYLFFISYAAVTQSIFSRPSQFDNGLPISTLDDVFQSQPDQLWLHVPVSL